MFLHISNQQFWMAAYRPMFESKLEAALLCILGEVISFVVFLPALRHLGQPLRHAWIVWGGKELFCDTRVVPHISAPLKCFPPQTKTFIFPPKKVFQSNNNNFCDISDSVFFIGQFLDSVRDRGDQRTLHFNENPTSDNRGEVGRFPDFKLHPVQQHLSEPVNPLLAGVSHSYREESNVEKPRRPIYTPTEEEQKKDQCTRQQEQQPDRLTFWVGVSWEIYHRPPVFVFFFFLFRLHKASNGSCSPESTLREIAK